MEKLTRDELYSLEDYARARPEFRSHVMTHKRDRRVTLGPYATLYFEDRMTVQYQIQEMLRVERIFESEGIDAELEAYNPLIPDGSNLKATLMLEYPDPAQRREALAKLIGVEDRVWIRVDGNERVWAIADEDLERETQTKTSSVHFVRFELTAEMGAALKGGAMLSIGVDHESYHEEVDVVAEPVRKSLLADLD